MAYASGLGATLAVAEETTYGVAPVLTGARGFQFDRETMKYLKETRQGRGMRGTGGHPRTQRRVVVAQSAGGDVEMDLADKGMGFWLKQALGSASIAQIGATAAFKVTATSADLRTRSFAMQVGKPDVTGALQPHTYLGCKITGFEIGADNRDIAKFKATIDAKDERVDIAYAAPSYVAADAAAVFHFAGSALYVAGSATPVVGNAKFSLKHETPQNTDRFHTGAGGYKANPLESDWRRTTVDVDSEYIDQVTWTGRKYTDETFALVLLYEGPIITGATRSALRIALPAVKIDQADATIDSSDVVKAPVEITVLDNGTDPAITVEYTTSDTLV
jgi:hypothetical protein